MIANGSFAYGQRFCNAGYHYCFKESIDL